MYFYFILKIHRNLQVYSTIDRSAGKRGARRARGQDSRVAARAWPTPTGPAPSLPQSPPPPGRSPPDPARPPARRGRDAPRLPQIRQLPRAPPRRPPAHLRGGAEVTQAVCARKRRGALPRAGVGAQPHHVPPRPLPERPGAPAQVPVSPLIRGRYPGGGSKPTGSIMDMNFLL